MCGLGLIEVCIVLVLGELVGVDIVKVLEFVEWWSRSVRLRFVN